MTTPILKQLKLNVLSLAVLALTGCNGGELKDQTSNTASSQAATSSSQPAVLYEGNPFIPPEALTKAPKVEGQLRIADIPFTSPMFAECVFRTAIRDGLFYANEVKKLECGIESKNLFASFNGNANLTFNLEYLNYFQGLESLTILGSWISELDLSGLAHLKHLVINSTPIKTLDLSANKQLESLEVNDTLLRDLNVGGLKKLKSLSLKTINTTPGVSGEDLLFDAWVNCVGFKHTDQYLTFSIERLGYPADGAVASEFVDLTYADYAQPLTVQGLEELDLDVLQICKIPLMGRPTLSAKREMRVYHAGDVEINASSNELEILHIEGANSLTQFTVPAAPNLRDLKLKENGMTMLEFSLSNYPVLKTLNLSDNQLTQFNPSVKFPELTHVALSNNKLSQGNHIDSDKKLEYLLINSAFTDAEKGPLSHWLTLYTPKIEHLEVFDTPINQVAGMEVNQVACEEKLLDVNCAQYGVGAFGDGNLDETFWRAHTANSEY